MTLAPTDLLDALQARAARTALGPSSMRGAGSAGVVAAGRPVLRELQLGTFATSRARRFRAALDQATERLLRSFPRRARRWGLARKGLNIFLRDCLYTVYLRDAYGLGLAESLYELPLDSITGRALFSAARGELPRWTAVRRLRPAVSDRYQAFAAGLSRERGFARVHLDAFWWGQRGDATGA
jgi:hypothetical protein